MGVSPKDHANRAKIQTAVDLLLTVSDDDAEFSHRLKSARVILMELAEEISLRIPEEDLQVLTMDEARRRATVAALEHTGGVRSAAAKVLGIGERTLYRSIEKWKL